MSWIFVQCLIDGSSGFLVVGVIGLQGVGKSSLLNALASAGGAPGDQYGSTYFKEAGTVELLANNLRSSGIDLLCTQERMFLLDSQAALSLSLADSLIRSAGSFSNNPVGGLMAPHYTQVRGTLILSFFFDVDVLY